MMIQWRERPAPNPKTVLFDGNALIVGRRDQFAAASGCNKYQRTFRVALTCKHDVCVLKIHAFL